MIDAINESWTIGFTSDNDDDEKYIPYNQRPETYIMPVVFSIILVVGVVGNGLLVLILVRYPSLRNVPNTYILSLALGDLLVIVTCVPFTMFIYTIESWPWGLVVCKLSEYAKDISIGVSVFTLTALSAERYFAVVNPIRRHVTGLNVKPLTILSAALIWVLACVLAMPAILFSHVSTESIETENVSIHICNPFPQEFGQSYAKGIVLFKFIMYYALPLTIIASFYLGMARHLEISTKSMPGQVSTASQMRHQIRARKKVGKMVISFIVIFFVCFSPYQTFALWFFFYPRSREVYNNFCHFFRMVAFCLCFINSCVNPIALYFISATFRKRFNEYLCCCSKSQVESEERESESRMSRRRRDASIRNETSFISSNRRHTQELNSISLLNTGTNGKPT